MIRKKLDAVSKKKEIGCGFEETKLDVVLKKLKLFLTPFSSDQVDFFVLLVSILVFKKQGPKKKRSKKHTKIVEGVGKTAAILFLPLCINHSTCSMLLPYAFCGNANLEMSIFVFLFRIVNDY